jgi:hypothetical protein
VCSIRQSTMKILILCLLLFTTAVVEAKPRFVMLALELEHAALIEYSLVMSYTDRTIQYMALDDGSIFSAGIFGPVRRTFSIDDELTGFWPLKGDTVLVVVDINGYASLFAKKQNGFYRFWSPYFTGSTASFKFLPPAIKLPECDERKTLDGMDRCWDGCLLPVDSLETYKRR